MKSIYCLAMTVLICGCSSNHVVEQPAPSEAPKAAAPGDPPKPHDGWVSLFDGRSLGNWASTNFGGEGEVRVEDGAIVLPMGSSMTGVTWQGEPPFRVDYEIELEAMRTLGNDFFCGLTFPINDAPCTLIVAGWGGAVVGLSTIDGADASQNPTTTFVPFENDRWYRIRLRVHADRVRAWIDGKQVIDADLAGRRISIRPEVEKSRPLGIATWNSEGRIKNIRWRTIAPEQSAGPADGD